MRTVILALFLIAVSLSLNGSSNKFPSVKAECLQKDVDITGKMISLSDGVFDFFSNDSYAAVLQETAHKTIFYAVYPPRFAGNVKAILGSKQAYVFCVGSSTILRAQYDAFVEYLKGMGVYVFLSNPTGHQEFNTFFPAVPYRFR